MPADEDRVGAGLGGTGRDQTDPGRRHELDADSCRGVEAPQIEDQLRLVLDAVDVVVHRRRNERLSRLRVPQQRDVIHDLDGWHVHP